jgi:glycosyltransferase involved in cell wall biosynthesis
MKRKLPVIIAGFNCLSGVTTWADQLRAALADHPRYDVRLLFVGREASGNYDILASDIEEAQQIVRSMAPAIVIPNYVWELFLTGLEPGIQCLGMCHADNEDQYYRPLGWYEPVISKFIAVSQECNDHLTKRLTCRAHNIATLPYGIHVPRTLNRTYQTKPLRLIYAGRVTQPQKRVWDFIPLIEHLLRAHVPFVFDIVGEGDEFEPLEQIMRARVPAADVRFHPRVPHKVMAANWSNHDIFVQVSDFEGTSVSMLEAMAHGAVPVVTAASSGINGVINRGDNGFVVPVGDMEAMAQVMGRLASDETLLPNAGRAAYKTAQAYAMESYCEKFVQILDQVADSDPNVDYHKRYGMYSPTHPLFVQQQVIAAKQVEIDRLNRQKRPALKRLLDEGYQGLRRSRLRVFSRRDKRAA